ncbi:hypothetical protein [Catenulispora subtropica]|uniref:Ribosomal protein L7/L12 C-terminal domain-containing protein n=1 Tax=Catenulispora subtropica TaxID=450798 RepID=A0ABN2QFE8_9ACTN
MESDSISTEQRLAAIEAKLDLLLARLGIDEGAAYGFTTLPPTDHLPAPMTDPVLDLVRGDMPIQAIKLYRERTGASLREAKAAIDALKARVRAERG